MIDPSAVSSDEGLARSILLDARSAAPCIDSFAEDSEEYKNAIAVLKRAANEAAERGSRLIESHTAGRTNVKYGDRPDISDRDLARLRTLCESSTDTVGPIGCFPEPDEPNLWPEERYL